MKDFRYVAAARWKMADRFHRVLKVAVKLLEN